MTVTRRGPSTDANEWDSSDYRMYLSSVPGFVITDSAPTPVTERGAVFHDYVNPTLTTRDEIAVLCKPYDYTIQSLDLDKATVSGDTTTYVSAGNATFLANTKFGGELITLTQRQFTTATYRQFQNYEAGSFALAVAGETDALLAGKSQPNLAFITNTVKQQNCWAPLNLLAGAVISAPPVTIWCAAISPLHMLSARHVAIPQSFVFRGNDGSVVGRTVVGHQDLTGGGAYETDFRISKLNSPLPATVPFFKVPPADFGSYLPALSSTSFPVIYTNRYAEACCGDLESTNLSANKIGFQGPKVKQRRKFYRAGVGGDSSAPMFALAEGELILLGNRTYLNEITTTWTLLDKINAAMTVLGGGYQLTEFDMSAYTNFEPVPIPPVGQALLVDDFDNFLVGLSDYLTASE